MSQAPMAMQSQTVEVSSRYISEMSGPPVPEVTIGDFNLHLATHCELHLQWPVTALTRLSEIRYGLRGRLDRLRVPSVYGLY